MKLEEVQALMNQFEDSDIRELKIDNGDFHLYLSKNKLNNTVQSTQRIVEKVPEEKIVKNSEQPEIQEKTKNDSSTDTPVKAPLVGVVYLQAKPGQPAYVKIGDHINKGDTVCIIEAMKMMTEVKSTVSGTVTEIKVENEDLVEVDQPLIMVKED